MSRIKRMRRALAVVLVASCAVGAAVPTARGQTPSAAQLLGERRVVTEVSEAAEPLRASLRAEVEKVLAAGRLAPFRTLYGEGGLRYHWREPWQMVYTLSRAMPYLEPATQDRVRAYLRDRIAEAPPWQPQLLGPEGTLRQPVDVERPLFNAGCQGGETRSAFFPYALWAYADTTGDWETVRANWPAIQQAFARKVDPRPTLETLSGAIGMHRLATHLDDDAAAQNALSIVEGFLRAATDFETIRANATRAYTGQERWNREAQGIVHAFLNLTPEAARLLAGSPELKAGAEAHAAAGRRAWPFWWMAQAPIGAAGYYGEGCCAGPEQREMLFAYEAWVAGLPAATLARYTDVPDALIGDCSYLQNVVTAIEAQGQAQWQPIRR